MQRSFRSLALAMALAVFLVYLVMACAVRVASSTRS